MSQLQAVLNNQAVNSGINWDDYESKADKYINHFSKKYGIKSRVNGNVLRRAGENTYNQTKVQVPLELALSQAQFETKFGTDASGRKNYANNIYNVGEYDNKTVYSPKTVDEGVQKYYDLMANDYVRDKTLDDLLTNFVNYQGNRYASDPQYEKKLKSQVGTIRNVWGQQPITQPTTFNDAFRNARKQGLKTFVYQGKSYTTDVK